jgi:hypothetical protein
MLQNNDPSKMFTSFKDISKQLRPTNSVLLEKPTVAHVVNTLMPIIEPEGSLQCSHEPDAGPYPRSDDAHLYALFLELEVELL